MAAMTDGGVYDMLSMDIDYSSWAYIDSYSAAKDGGFTLNNHCFSKLTT